MKERGIKNRCRIYDIPKDEACKIAIDTVKKYSNKNIQVKFVCYEELDYKLYLNYLNGIDKGVFEL
jgi:O-acetyl-ADP-ribose deacetylase (regulator of RNase III)